MAFVAFDGELDAPSTFTPFTGELDAAPTFVPFDGKLDSAKPQGFLSSVMDKLNNLGTAPMQGDAYQAENVPTPQVQPSAGGGRGFVNPSATIDSPTAFKSVLNGVDIKPLPGTGDDVDLNASLWARDHSASPNSVMFNKANAFDMNDAAVERGNAALNAKPVEPAGDWGIAALAALKNIVVSPATTITKTESVAARALGAEGVADWLGKQADSADADSASYAKDLTGAQNLAVAAGGIAGQIPMYVGAGALGGPGAVTALMAATMGGPAGFDARKKFIEAGDDPDMATVKAVPIIAANGIIGAFFGQVLRGGVGKLAALQDQSIADALRTAAAGDWKVKAATQIALGTAESSAFLGTANGVTTTMENALGAQHQDVLPSVIEGVKTGLLLGAVGGPLAAKYAHDQSLKIGWAVATSMNPSASAEARTQAVDTFHSAIVDSVGKEKADAWRDSKYQAIAIGEAKRNGQVVDADGTSVVPEIPQITDQTGTQATTPDIVPPTPPIVPPTHPEVPLGEAPLDLTQFRPLASNLPVTPPGIVSIDQLQSEVAKQNSQPIDPIDAIGVGNPNVGIDQAIAGFNASVDNKSLPVSIPASPDAALLAQLQPISEQSAVLPVTESLVPAVSDSGNGGVAPTQVASGPKQDSDWLQTLFGNAPAEQPNQPTPAAKTLDVPTLRATVEKLSTDLQAQRDDWANRDYKANGKQVMLNGDGPSNQGSMSVSAINEGRRAKVVQAADAQLGQLGKLDTQLKTPDGAKAFTNLVQSKWDQAQAFKPQSPDQLSGGALFERLMIDALKLQPAQGSYTSLPITKALRATMENQPTEKPLVNQAPIAQQTKEEGSKAPVAIPANAKPATPSASGVAVSNEAPAVTPLQAEIAKARAMSQSAPIEAAPAVEPEFVKIRTRFGDTRYFKQADLDSTRTLLPSYTAKGERRPDGAVHRENLDPTGEIQAAENAKQADNPFFNVITNKQGGAFTTKTAASLELNKRGLKETHEVVPASEVASNANGGFVLRRKAVAPIADQITAALESVSNTDIAKLALKDSEGALKLAQARKGVEGGQTMLSRAQPQQVKDFTKLAQKRLDNFNAVKSEVMPTEPVKLLLTDFKQELFKWESTRQPMGGLGPAQRNEITNIISRALDGKLIGETEGKELFSAAKEGRAQFNTALTAMDLNNRSPEADKPARFKGVQPSGYPVGGWHAIGEDGRPMRKPSDKFAPRFKTGEKATEFGLAQDKINGHAPEAAITKTERQPNQRDINMERSARLAALYEFKRQTSFNSKVGNIPAEKETAIREAFASIDRAESEHNSLNLDSNPKEWQASVDGLLTKAEEAIAATRPDWINAPAKPAENAPKIEPSAQPAGKIEDFGQVLEGGRKNQAPSLSKELSDEALATEPLSKVWPADEYLAIDDKFAAAVSFVARTSVPRKPNTPSKVARWVENVKTVRSLAQMVNDGRLSQEKLSQSLANTRSLSQFADKVALLEAIDKNQWSRIGSVEVFPDAYRYNDDGSQTKTPLVRVAIDDRNRTFDGASSVADVVERVSAMLDTEVQQDKKMQFEVRGTQSKGFSINKKGDKEYRKLKTFPTAKEALTYIKSNYDDVVAAWEGVKARDNVHEDDVRNTENRPRTGTDHRNGKDATTEMFSSAFGFKGVEFGNWVSQGKNAKERQGMLNQAYDALLDLADIVGVPSKALSLDGSLGLSFGSRGHGGFAAHFEPDNLVINLTKTRGAGNLAHEWLHSLDNYFSRQRQGGEPVSLKDSGGTQQGYREHNNITYRPEPMYVRKSGISHPITKAKLEANGKDVLPGGYYSPENWHIDPKHPQGVRPEVERKFAELVEALDASPMTHRANSNDSGTDGYWGRIIERAARSFENYVISKMLEKGYQNDYLANVKDVQDFQRDKGRYPYLLPEEVAPIAEAFDNLFSTIKTKETDQGVALFNLDRTNIDTASRRMTKFVDAFLAGQVKSQDTQLLGSTPNVLRLVGAEPLQMQIDGETVRKILAGKHDQTMTADRLKQSVEGIYDPLMIFDSPDEITGEQGKILITEVTDRTGNQVIALVHLSKHVGRMVVNDIASVYGLEGIPDRSKIAPNKLLYVRDEEGLATSTTPNLRKLAGVVQKARDLGVNVLSQNNVVNRFGSTYSQVHGKISNPITVLDRIAYQGYEKQDVPIVQGTRKLNGIVEKYDAGKLTPAEFELQTRLLAARMAEASTAKSANRIMSERARGADLVREKLIAARRRGDLNPDIVDFALWALAKNPQLAEGLGVSIKQPGDNTPAGQYNPTARIMTLFKDSDNEGTAVHEIMHHTERMMPEDVQKGIRTEWAKAYAKAVTNATPEQLAALDKMLESMTGNKQAHQDVSNAFKDGTLNYDRHYQLVNPSEYWAVNAARILQSRYEAKSWIGKAKQWMGEMVQKVKGILGMRSDAAVLKGLDSIANGDGTFQSKKMMSQGDVFADVKDTKDDRTAEPEPKYGSTVPDITHRGLISNLIHQGLTTLSEGVDKAGNKSTIYNALAPMSAGTQKARAQAQQWINNTRVADFTWKKIDDALVKEFSPAERTRMWDAGDEENDIRRNRRLGVQSDDTNKGLDSLTPKQRSVMDQLHTFSQELWERAKAVGTVSGEGVDYWTPRQMVKIGESGEYERPGEGKQGTSDGIGRNFSTAAGSTKERKHVLASETEAAMQSKGGEMVRDIRTMPLAMAKIEKAIASRELINQIKELGTATGKELVNNTGGEGFFTLDHPAFKTWSPRMTDYSVTKAQIDDLGYVIQDGKVMRELKDGSMKELTSYTVAKDGSITQLMPTKDEAGNVVMDAKPIYISNDYKGPLRAILSQRSSDNKLYTGYMLLKSKAMSAIMFSPLIHNQVIFGRALAYGGIRTPALYFTGNAAKNNLPFMREAIGHGLVPIGNHNSMLDVGDIANNAGKEGGWLDQNESWVSLGAGKVFGKTTKDALDKIGDVAHNKLLWDRVGDLQAGIAKDAYDHLISIGHTHDNAMTAAAHLGNRYAGAIGKESMSEFMHQFANIFLFSKSFNMGNVGTVKDAFYGLPAGLKAQLLENSTPAQAEQTISFLKSKARWGMVRDLAYAIVLASLVQDWFKRDKKKDFTDQADNVMDGYTKRAVDAWANWKDNPLSPSSYNPYRLSSTFTNEPGKQNRVDMGPNETGRHQFMRLPTGKVIEDVIGWTTNFWDTLYNKKSPFVTAIERSMNIKDKWGTPVWDSADPNFAKKAYDLAKAVIGTQAPTDQIQTAKDLATGYGTTLDKEKMFGNITGFTVSQGHPGGPKAAIASKVEERVSNSKKYIMELIRYNLKPDENGVPRNEIRAHELGVSIGLTPAETNKLVNKINVQNRATTPKNNLSAQQQTRFRKHANQEEKGAMQNVGQ